MFLDLDEFQSVPGLKIVYLNVRSLLRHHEEVAASLLNGKVNVLVLGETWLHANVASSLIQVNGYFLLRYDRRTLTNAGNPKSGGGLCIYVRNELKVDLRLDLMFSSEDLELMVCTVSPDHQKRIKLLAVYRPPSGNLESALSRLANAIETMKAESSGETVVMGDVNVDYSQNSSQTRKVKNAMNKWFLYQHIAEKTRITHSAASLIDLAFSDIRFLSSAGVLNLNISDHLPIFIIKKKPRETGEFSYVTGRQYRDFDMCRFIDDLQDLKVEEVFSTDDPNEIWHRLYSFYLAVIDLHCPKKRLRVRKNRPQFISEELIKLMRDRDLAFKQARKSKVPRDWNQAKLLRSTVQTKLFEAKRDYIASQINKWRQSEVLETDSV